MMKSKFVETLSHSKNYLIAEMATAGLAIITIPIFTRLFTPEEYGLVAVFRAYVVIFVPILSINAFTSISRYYYEKSDDFDEFLGSTMILTGSAISINLVLLIVFYDKLVDLFNVPHIIPILITVNAINLILSSMYMQILIPQKRSKEVAVIRIISAYLAVTLSIILVFNIDENKYMGQIYGIIIVGFGFSVYYFYKILQIAKLKLVKKHTKYITGYSLPLLPYALSGVILAIFDRIMINNIEGSGSAGLYSLAYNIALILIMVVTATNSAVGPEFFDLMDSNNNDRLDLLIRRIQSVISIAGLTIMFFADEIITILAEESYHEAVDVIPIVIIGIIFYSMFAVYGRYIGYSKKTIYSSVTILIAGISNIVLNSLFIPKYGYIAAAYTTLVSYLILFLITWFVVKFQLNLNPTALWIILKPTILLLILFLVYLLMLNFTNFYILRFIIKILLLAIFSLSLFMKDIKILIEQNSTTIS
ncbi:MAG: hypothetical protein HeimC2_18150 [Candidatus Heimdallarchaeota archaeon LC_2]|nr:MAG: hypothetical protein HeimC2_18150 [Candidatus Heimdallarchaeota archaeon LC_2]